MVTATLDVEGGKIELFLALGFVNQEVSNLTRDSVVHLRSETSHHSAEQTLERVFEERLRLEEGITQRTAVCRAVRADRGDCGVEQGVAYTECGSREFIRHHRLHAPIVPPVGRKFSAGQGWNELVVHDGLHLGGHDVTSELIDLLVVEGGIGGGNLSRNPVVLPGENRVQRDEVDVFVDAGVSGLELAFAISGQEVVGEVKASTLPFAQPLRLVVAHSIHTRGVHIARQLVDGRSVPLRSTEERDELGLGEHGVVRRHGDG